MIFDSTPDVHITGRSGTVDLNGDGRPNFALRETLIDESGPDTVYAIYSPYSEASFTRGDANRDGRIDISDRTYILTFLFLGGARPPCMDAADADDTGKIEFTDGVYLLNHLFLGGEPPPAPYPGEGADATEDELGCVGF